MMVLRGGNTGKRHEEKSLESPCSHHLHHHQYLSPKSIIWIMLLVIAADVSCLLLYHSAYHNNPFLAKSQGSKQTFTSQEFGFEQANMSSPSQDSLDFEHELVSQGNDQSSPNESAPRNLSSVNQENDEAELKRVLSKASMAKKTVIITIVNAAWTSPNSIFDLFLESFRIGNQTETLLNHLVVVSLDQKAYFRCLELHPHCYALKTEDVNFSGKADFMSSDYLKMMWRRIAFLHTVLQMGYTFIFTDADIMWFRNPFQHFHIEADFQIACDQFQYNSSDLNNSPNGGFIYVKSNNITIQFYKFWYESKDTYPGNHDQDVLNKIKFDPIVNKIGLKIKFLDTIYFGGFCEPSKDFNVVCTMHANCCTSLDSKIHDLQMVIDDWKKYMTLPRNNQTRPYSWTMSRYCG